MLLARWTWSKLLSSLSASNNLFVLLVAVSTQKHSFFFDSQMSSVTFPSFSTNRVPVLFVVVLSGVLLLFFLITFALDQWRQRQRMDGHEQFKCRRDLKLSRMQSVRYQDILPTASQTTVVSGQPTARVMKPHAAEASVMSKLCVEAMMTEHPLLAPFASSADSNYGAHERVLALSVIIMVGFVADAIVFQPTQRSISQICLQILFSVLITIPTSIVAGFMGSLFFEYSRRHGWDARFTHHPDSEGIKRSVEHEMVQEAIETHGRRHIEEECAKLSVSIPTTMAELALVELKETNDKLREIEFAKNLSSTDHAPRTDKIETIQRTWSNVFIAVADVPNLLVRGPIRSGNFPNRGESCTCRQSHEVW